MKRGIFLVANLKSQKFCENLIYSIRNSGCKLPIRLIHFGGKKINSKYILEQAELLYYDSFPEEAKHFISNLRTVLTDCPLGFLYRYLAWFSDWDEFLYSDNDIVALSNWERMFNYLKDADFVHADEEYTTKGKFNYNQPDALESIFGEGSLKSAVTAGHFLVKKNSSMINDINHAVEWFKNHSSIPKKHDQSLMHVASLLGNWKMLNLCKPPYNWISSWAGDYKNSLHLIQAIQNNDTRISHLHYSGSTPIGNRAIEDLLFSKDTDRGRIKNLVYVGMSELAEYYEMKRQSVRIKRYINSKLQ